MPEGKPVNQQMKIKGVEIPEDYRVFLAYESKVGFGIFETPVHLGHERRTVAVLLPPRPVIEAILRVDGSVELCWGMAACSERDQFSRKIGRSIAVGRAVHYLVNSKLAPESLRIEARRFKYGSLQLGSDILSQQGLIKSVFAAVNNSDMIRYRRVSKRGYG